MTLFKNLVKGILAASIPAGVAVFIREKIDLNSLIPALPSWTVRSLTAAFSLLIIGLVIELSDSGSFLRSQWARLTRTHKRWCAGLLTFIALLVHFQVPAVHRILFDEQIYENIAQTVAFTNRATMCSHCEAEKGDFRSLSDEVNKDPSGYPFFLAMFYRLFGVRESAAFATGVVVMLLGAISCFSILFFAGAQARTGLFGAAFFALTPMVLRWGHTTAADVPSAAFSALAVAVSLAFFRRPTGALLAASAGAVAYAIQVRPEAVMILGPILLLALLIGDESLFSRLWIWIAMISTVLIPHFTHLLIHQNESWGSPGAKFTLEQFFWNIGPNAWFYGVDRLYPVLWTLLAAVGLVLWPSERRVRALVPVLFVWFLCFWGIFLFFYAGSYEYGADVRFSVLSAAPLALLAALGVDRILAFTEQAWSRSRLGPQIALQVTVIFLVIHWTQFLPAIKAVGEEASDARADAEFADRISPSLPPDSIVVSQIPWLFILNGHNAIQQARMNDALFARYRGGVYFHWSYWCNIPNFQDGFCDRILKTHPSQLIEEKIAYQHRYALYQISPGLPPSSALLKPSK